MPARLVDALFRLSTAIGGAQTLPDVFDAALDVLQGAFGVRRASILLFDSDGVMRFKAWRDLSDRYRAGVEGHSPWSAGDPPPEPLIVHDVRDEASLQTFLPLLAGEGIASAAFVPLVAEGRLIGTLALYGDTPGTFSDVEVSAARTIGFLIGFAVERTRRTLEAETERQRLMFALEAASMGTWEWDIATQQVRWSDSLERLHGMVPGAFRGDFGGFEREIHEEDRPRVLASVRRALDEGAPHDVEYRIVAPDGGIRWLHGKGRVERDAEGRPTRMTGVCMDVTTRKQVEAENARLFEEAQRLLAQEAGLRERLTLLADGAHRLVTTRSARSVISEVLDVAARVVTADGYALWRKLGQSWRIAGSRGLSEDFTAAAVADANDRYRFDRPVVAADLGKVPMLADRMHAYADEGVRSLLSVPLTIGAESTGSLAFYYRQRHEPNEGELRVAMALGHLASAAINNAELYLEQQNLRTRAEVAQQRAAFLAEASACLSSLDYEENLRSVARLAVPQLCDWCAVDLIDEQQRVMQVAVSHIDAAKVALAEDVRRRYPVDVSQPRGIGRVLRTGEPELYSDITDSLLAESARDEEHLRILRRVGLRSAMIVPLAAGSRVFGAITFASSAFGRRYDRADLEFAAELGRRAAFAIENARLYRNAQAANRVKDEFLATVSHELRTPLNVIMGRARMLASVTDAATARQIGDILERNSVTLARLVDDLLDMSRITLGQVKLEPQLVHLPAVIETAIQAVQPAAAARQIALVTAVAPDVPDCAGDPTRLQQVIWNLLTNAVKFTPPGGRVEVALRAEGQDLVLSVADTGEGIPAEALPRIFEMFWQAEATLARRHSGLGIGLSIVRQLVELHGGRVSAESDGPGRGATFRVFLPAAGGALPASPGEVMFARAGTS